jgi:nucleoside-diphosphate-sugar epimerase
MTSVLVVGGTRFVGRHAVEEFLAHDYDVTLYNRGNHDNPFAADDRVDRIQGDRTDDAALLGAARDVDPDVVVDCVAYHPRDVRQAVEIFAGVDAYVYVSSGAAYGREDVPKREGETPLRPCDADQAVDDSMASYGARKAEGDRAVVEAAERGIPAMSVRPPVVYGPYDYTERLAYWVDRVRRHDRVIVPGDGTNLWQRVYVGDVASALRLVAEAGTPGEAYNVGDRNATTLDDTLDLVESALLDLDEIETRPERVYASPRELSIAGIDPDDFPCYRPNHPHLLDTHNLEQLGWRATPRGDAHHETVVAHVEHGLTGEAEGPSREAEERLLDVLDTI